MFHRLVLCVFLVSVICSEDPAPAALTRTEADAAAKKLWQEYSAHFRQSHAVAFKDKKLIWRDVEMRFDFKTFGETPASGRSLFISLHGGGGTTKAINDGQWRNQLRLYRPEEGIYVCPRAPTDAWNMWHQPHIDPLFDELIRCFVIFEGVNPNRVYLLGYSAGGDGLYQLAPRMADRWAAAAMMAGHPGDASPLGLRNLPFAIHVGEKDTAYDRNKLGAVWKEKLDELRKADPEGYVHEVQIHPVKGHWMDRQDAVAVPWMSGFTRKPFPKRVVWRQDDVTHPRFYWLAVPLDEARAGAQVVASIANQTIEVQTTDVRKLFIRLNDQMLNIDEPIAIRANGKVIFTGKVTRSHATLKKTLEERGDFISIYPAELMVDIPAAASPGR